MRKFILLAFFGGTLLLGNAQNKVDSLQQVLLTAKDTSRVNALAHLAYQLVFRSPEEAEKRAREAIDLATRINHPAGKAKALQMLGISFDIRGQYAQAIQAYKEGLEIIQTLTPSSAHQDVEGSLRSGLGLAYYHLSDYQQALELFLDLLKLYENPENPVKLANLYNNIGLVYHDQKEMELALSYYLKSYEFAQKSANKNIAGRAANNIGLIYKEKENYTEALRYYEISLAMKRALLDDNGLSATYQNIAVIYKRMKEYAKAMDYLDLSIALKQKLDDKLGMIQANDTRAEIFILQGSYDKARYVVDENYRLVAEIGAREPRLLVYERYYELAKVQRKFEEALMWYQRRTALHDSLFNEAKSKQMAELQTQFELDKKEAEIKRLESVRDFQQLREIISIALIATLVAFIVIGLIWFLQKQKLDRKYFDAQQELARIAIVNAKFREEELTRELGFKNRELTSYTVNFIQKSKLMEEMKESLASLKVAPSPEVSKKIQEINKIIDSNYQIDKEWDDFKLHFEKVHPGFFEELKVRFPDLTSGDLKLCALLKLNMNMKESAKILGISPDSVKTARYRLRKKLNLAKEEALFDFMYRIENESLDAV